MRIALITPGFSFREDPWCIPLLRNLALGLGRTHDIRVYAAYYPAYHDTYALGSLTVSSFGRRRSGRLTRVLQDRRLLAAVRQDHVSAPFDVIHGFWANGGGRLAVRAGSTLGLPALVSVMAGELSYVSEVRYGMRYRTAGLLGRLALRNAAAVITISAWQESLLRQDFPDLLTVCLPPGVDTGLFTPDGPADAFGQGVNILAVGSLVPVKGHEVLLRAFRIARQSHPEIRLHIAGDGPLRGELERRVHAMELQEVVTFHGHVEHDRLPHYYRSADFCVLGSWFETSGLVLFEAAACGCPTVGSNTGSLPDLAPPELRSVPGDAASLAGAIKQLLDAPERRRRLGEEALNAVREHYTMEHMIDRYTREYERRLG